MTRHHRCVVLLLAVASAVAARIVAHAALSDIPHVMDESAYLFQAKLFARAQLFAPVALPRAAFTMWFIDDRVARYSTFPPGWRRCSRSASASASLVGSRRSCMERPSCSWAAQVSDSAGLASPSLLLPSTQRRRRRS